MRPVDKELIEQGLMRERPYWVYTATLDDYAVTVGMMEMVPAIRVEDTRQVFDVFLRTPSDGTLVPVIFECKHLQEANGWIQQLKYIVMKCCEGTP